jgi:4-amino-4-deoxy-L-arabinose transferase-like glycosyltransferase
MKVKKLKEFRKKINFLIVLFSSIFLIFRIFTFVPVFSDENIYINMAKALTSGLLPYKDFFYAHPPLQLILLAPLTFFNFQVVKIGVAIIGLICVFLTYLIAKELFERNVGNFASIFFLFFPGFLIFGSQAMGMFEALAIFLLGFFLFLKKKLSLASFLFTLSFFTRYFISLLFLLVFVFAFLKFKKREIVCFSFYLISFLLLFFTFFYILFGYKFIEDTIIYHLGVNIKQNIGIAGWIDQYLTLGFFTIFLSFFSLVFGIFNKNKLIFLFSIFPLIYDSIVILILKQVIYHYFILPLPFLFIALAATFIKTKYLSLKFFLLTILIFCFYTNLQSLSYYFGIEYNKVFSELENYTLQKTTGRDLIFGEPRSTNYVSFVTNRRIINNYFDSDLKFINFYGKEKFLNEIEKIKPKLLFIDESHNSFLRPILKNYELIKEWNAPGYYHLYLFELRE